MFKEIPTKTKLLIPMWILTFIVFVLGAIAIFYSYNKMNALAHLNEDITISSHLSQTLHSLQKERGLSCGYIENNETIFKKKLVLQRKESDFQLRRIINEPVVANKLLTDLSNLNILRNKIDSKTIRSKEVIDYYSKVNSMLLQIIIDISKTSHVPHITQNIIAYINFLYLKEYGGIERVNGVVIFAHKHLSNKEILNFANLLSIEKHSENMFLYYACANIYNDYKQVQKEKVFQELKTIEHQILDGNISTVAMDSQKWYELITKKLNILDSIGKSIESHTLELIDEEFQKVKFIFIFVVFLTLVSFIVFLIMLKAFLHLADEERKLRLVSQKYIISSVTDLKGKIIDVSDAFCEISGYTRDELIGKNHNLVRHPDMPKRVFRDIWATIQEGGAWKGKVKNLKKDGSSYWVWANIEPLYNSKGKIDAYMSIRLDITESELLQEKIKTEEEKHRIAKEMMYQQSRLAQMGEMLSMIAHQWRQPLSAITAASGAINLKAKLKKLDDETAIDLSSKIMEFSQHLSTTIDDFRGFFKTNKTKVETNFKKMVEDVESIVRTSLEHDSIALEIIIHSHKEFLTFESELKQVLLNLVKNAQDALNENKVENPKIIIEVRDKTISVSDNGGGIKVSILNKIFDPYFSTKKKKDGTGLGLYMSKTIVEDHCGGVLEVFNAKGGAKFVIKI